MPDRQYDTIATITQPGYVPNVPHVVYQTAGIALLLAIGAGLMLAGLAALGVVRRPVGLVFVAGVAIAFLPALVWRIFEVDKSLTLKRVERALQRDIDGDDKIADTPVEQAPGHSMTVNAEQARQEVRRQVDRASQVQTVQDLLAFVDRAWPNKTSESLLDIKPKDRPAYVMARETLMDIGVARWRKPGNTKLGWEFVPGLSKTSADLAIRQHVIDV